ncbi:MAG: hypothetical protein ACD_67C00038G0001 [uncultured bacterium]|nr:MAG: hypothetical protein ACD_67C00038G0001 [uncultured bacterium]
MLETEESLLLEKILGMKLNDLRDYVIKKADELGLFAVEPGIFDCRRKLPYLEFLARHVHHNFAKDFLRGENGVIMTGMFQEDEPEETKESILQKQ